MDEVRHRVQVEGRPEPPRRPAEAGALRSLLAPHRHVDGARIAEGVNDTRLRIPREQGGNVMDVVRRLLAAQPPAVGEQLHRDVEECPVAAVGGPEGGGEPVARHEPSQASPVALAAQVVDVVDDPLEPAIGVNVTDAPKSVGEARALDEPEPRRLRQESRLPGHPHLGRAVEHRPRERRPGPRQPDDEDVRRVAHDFAISAIVSAFGARPTRS